MDRSISALGTIEVGGKYSGVSYGSRHLWRLRSGGIRDEVDKRLHQPSILDQRRNVRVLVTESNTKR